MEEKQNLRSKALLTLMFSEYAKLLKEKQRQVEELTILNKIGQILSSTFDLETILSLVLKGIKDMLNADASSILLYEEKIDKLVFKAATGAAKEKIKGLTLSPDEGIAGWVMKYKEPLVISKSYEDPRFCQRIDAQTGFTTRSLLCAPLVTRDKVLGAIEVVSESPDYFGERDLKLLTTLATSAAIAIQNAQLYESVLEEKRKTEYILRDIAEGVYTVDHELRILSFNPAAERMTGWRAEEISGHFCTELFSQDDIDPDLPSFKEIHLQLLNGRGPLSFSYDNITLTRKDGQKLPVSISLAPLFSSGNRVMGVVGVFRDISTEKELEKLKAEFIAAVSHHLRSPLNNISASVDLMLESSLDQAQQESILKIIQSESSRLAKFVTEILDVSLLESGQVTLRQEPIALLPLIRKIINILKKKNVGRQLIISAPPKLPLALADESKVEIILQNLLDNAVNYSPEGATITIEMEEKMEEIVVSVLDEGMGIPPEHMEKIFQKFYRIDSGYSRSVHGYGLGLYITKKLVEMQGGRIWVESKVNSGSRFSFSLPKAK